MVKLFQMWQDDAEYLGLLLIKSSDPQSYSNGHKRGIFYFSVLWNPQFLYTKNGFTALKLVANNFLMVKLCYVEKILLFFKAMHHVHVHLYILGIRHYTKDS